MTRTLARLTAWAAIIAVLMAFGFLGWLLKAAITPPISAAVDWIRVALGSYDYLFGYGIYAFLIVGSIWFIHGAFFKKHPTD